MKSFHKTMGILSGIFLLMIIVSISVSSSYMTRHNITFPELFSETGNITYGVESGSSFWRTGEKSSNYETITIENSDSYELVDELFISASIEEILFVEEDRKDILVEYYRELPDTKNYQVNYKTTVLNNKLSISSTLKVNSLSINKDYEGFIKIYVPNDYQFDKVTIDSAAAKITSQNIYTKTNSLSAIASFGDIDIDIDSPIDEVIISCDLGSIEVNVNSKINNLDISCDLGEINLKLNEHVETLTISEDMGDIQLKASSTLGSVDIENNLGSIDAEFLENVNKVIIANDLGDINVDFYKNDDISIYIDTDLGNTSSDFTTISSKDADYKFTSNLGSIDVNSH